MNIEEQKAYIDKQHALGLTKDITKEFWESEEELRKTVYNPEDYLKLYIAVLDDVPDFMVPTLVAHSMLGAHLEFTQIPNLTCDTVLDSEEGFYHPNILLYEQWLFDSFRKCVIRVNRKEFEKIKQLGNVYLGHENTTLGGEKSCAIPLPVWSNELPNVLKFAKLWKPKNV